jgi:hypothetical protein
MILIICAWFYFFVIIFGIGSGFLKIIGKFSETSHYIFKGDIFYTFWFGYVILIGLLQIFSLVFPINEYVLIFVSLISIIYYILNLNSVLSVIKQVFTKYFTSKGALTFLIITLIILLIAYSANREVEHGDTFIYHFNAVKWVKEYSVVPGLANLHSRLGFNSSFFLFAALTDVGIYANQSAHIALSFLMVTCLIHFFVTIFDSKQIITKKVFCMLTFSYLLIHSFWKPDINSLSTDYPTAILSFIFGILLLDNIKYKILLILPLSVIIFSFKISGIVALGIALIIFLGYTFKLKFEEKDKKNLGRVLLFSISIFAILLIGFIIRNAFVSGWLLYPFPFGNLHLPWSVPNDFVIDMIEWIKSYPKLPGGASPNLIKENNFFYWIIPWFDSFRKTTEYSLLFVSIFLLIFSSFNLKSMKLYFLRKPGLFFLLIFSLSGILFLFISAPDLRFGSFYFYILFASAVILVYENSSLKKGLLRIIFIVSLFLIHKEMSWFVFDREPNLFTFSYVKPLELNKILVSPKGEDPPLYIYMPVEGDACGNSPIPCSPYAGGFLHNHRGLRQRVPGNISKGFLPIEK